jgi:hypothetical protein
MQTLSQAFNPNKCGSDRNPLDDAAPPPGANLSSLRVRVPGHQSRGWHDAGVFKGGCPQDLDHPKQDIVEGLRGRAILSVGLPVGLRCAEIAALTVMLDADMAALYQGQARALIQAMKRNAEPFSERFHFSAISRGSSRDGGHNLCSHRQEALNTQPLAFTEHGVAMLSAVLRSERAVQMSIATPSLREDPWPKSGVTVALGTSHHL